MKKRQVIAILLCLFLCFGLLPGRGLTARDVSTEEKLAGELKALGLFRGVSDTDFDLERAPTRLEALVMLIRILGKEQEALSGNWSHPFTDVPKWADLYVGYAYSSGLTNGISKTEFGLSAAGAATYLTFVLRALGYSDAKGGDFIWDQPFSLAKSVGILPDRVDTTEFWRADVVSISYAALNALLKGSSQTLAQKLTDAGVFSDQAFRQHYDPSALSAAPASGKELTAQEIFELCSPAVFYIVTYDADGFLYAGGSGFFIEESGYAVTNCHVLENALSARVILADGRECEVAGLLYFDVEADFAILKVQGSDFPVLKLGDSSAAAAGERAYAIGNPQGLTNTISDGIISNPGREELGGMIQVTTPISHGSSGGALINSRGEAIGITTLGLASGQSLNFAVPASRLPEVSKLRPAEEEIGLFSMEEYADYLANRDFLSSPGMFLSRESESEPNDTPNDAQELYNGVTMSGDIVGGDVDVFLAYCNTPGLLEIFLYSESSIAQVKDLCLNAYHTDGSSEELIHSDCYESVYGSAMRYLSVPLDRAGVYEIYLFSDSLYLSSSLLTDYEFYYTFTPGAAEGETTTGAEYLSDFQRDAFDELKDWLFQNYIKPQVGYKEYYESSSLPDGTSEIKGIYYDEEYEELLVFLIEENDGFSTYTYLFLNPDNQEFYVDYYYDEEEVEVFSGFGYICAPEYEPQSPFHFSGTEGSADRSLMEDMAREAISSIIEYADDLLLEVSLNIYSMVDFGFLYLLS
ncbi:MAG: serine protease [Oscillospiraceae bacterium]|nr:serine protease [Oscillospiraceae bacterium]